jgi:alkylation response protein AidB-like acyl-CoA dehydrogenase
MPAEAALEPAVLPEALREELAQRAPAVDTAEADPRDALVKLTEAGLLPLGVPGREGTVAQQAAVLADVATLCMSTAFCGWGHRMAVEYLAEAADERFEDLASLRRIGSSAMAGAFKYAAGIEPLSVKARREGGQIVLNGRIPWASNLQADAIIVLTVDLEGAGPTVLTVDASAEGLTIKPARGLLALEATASGFLAFEDVRVPVAAVLDEPFEAFLARVRRPFLVLQSSFCLGLARAALEAAADKLEGIGTVFADEHAELAARRGELEARLTALADDPSAERRDLVRLRLESAHLVRDAVRVEAAVTGGRGYVASSPTARRLREAAFLPVQSPTEAHLRWELR